MGTHEAAGAALCIHDARVKFDNLTANTATTTTSDYTEQGPRPGSAVAGDARSLMTPEVSHAQAVDVTVTADRGGFPALSATEGARVVFDADGTEYGWSAPNELVGFDSIEWVASGSGVQHSAVATHPITGEPWVLYTNTTTAPLVRWNQATQAWVTVDSDVSGAYSTVSTPCALAFAPDGSVYVLVQRSDSSTWYVATYAPDATKTELTFSTSDIQSTAQDRARMVHVSGSTLLAIVEDTANDRLRQYVSDDLGVSWSLVVDSAASFGRSVSVFAIPASGGFGITYSDFTGGNPTFVRIESEWQALNEPTAVEVNAAVNVTELAGWADHNGTLYVLGEVPSTGSVECYVSYDSGLTWTEMDWSAFYLNDTGLHPVNIGVAPVAGGAVLVGNHVSPSATADESLTAIWLGGWSNRYNVPVNDLTQHAGYGNNGSATLDGRTWIAIQSPGPIADWTQSGPGGTLNPGYLTLNTTGGNSGFWYDSVNASLGEASWCCRINSGGSTGSNLLYLRIRLYTGVTTYDVYVRFSTTGVGIFDGTSTVQTVSLDTTVFREYRCVISGTTVRFSHRLRGWWNEWTHEAPVTIVTGAGSPTRFVFGHQGSTANSDWAWLNLRVGVGQAANVPAGPITTLPAPIPYAGSTDQVAYLRGIGGPAVPSTYTVDAEHDYPVEHAIDPVQYPSPSRGWRGTGTGTAVFTFELPYEQEDGTKVVQNTRQLIGSLFLCLLGANFRTAYLETYNGAGWDIRATLDLATGHTGIAFTATDNRISPDTSGTSGSRYIFENEVAGGTFIIAGVPIPVRVFSNSGGSWDASTDAHARVELDTANPVAGTFTGTGDLVWPSGVVVAHLSAPVSATDTLVRVRIPGAQACADPEYRIGSMLLGYQVRPMGADPEWGWVLQDDHDIETVTVRNRQRVRRLGPPATTWSWDWTGGQNWGRFRRELDHEYRAATSTTGWRTARDDVYGMIRGLMRENILSGEVPVVALQSLPDDGVTVTDPTLFLAGHLTGTPRFESVGGDPGVDEQGRVPTLQVRELV